VCPLTTLPIRTHCRLALDLFICDLPAFFDATDAAAVCHFLVTSAPDGASATGAGVAVAVGRVQQWPRVHEFVHSRARFLKAENVTKGCSDGAVQPHVLLSRAPSRKRKRSPSDPIIYTEFVLKKVNLGSDEAIAQVRSAAVALSTLAQHLQHAPSPKAVWQVASACAVSRHVFSRFGTKDKVALRFAAAAAPRSIP
jgi:hypothetical protein